ncbi:MAG: hypothetical protein NTY08_12380 [Proteobacteria bacterium]|nr:hypothetical protein [Pseudomonadota bacterium]
MSSPILDKNHWSSRFAVAQNRLREPLWWFPYPFLLAFGLVLLLMAHVLFTTNPRMGNPADVVTFPSTPQRDSAIWLSVTPIGNDVVVTTNDRKVFRWPQKIRSEHDIRELVFYLRERVHQEIQSAALLQRIYNIQTTAVIAADQRLKYLHLRPIIHALAQAGISNYGFETLNPVLTNSTQTLHRGGVSQE